MSVPSPSQVGIFQLAEIFFYERLDFVKLGYHKQISDGQILHSLNILFSSRLQIQSLLIQTCFVVMKLKLAWHAI